MNTSNYNALMAELKKEYLESFDEKFLKMKEFYQNKDWYSLELEYHKLKGTGSTYGVPEVTELCQHLERVCRENKIIDESLVLISIELLEEIRNKYIHNVDYDLSTRPHFIKICAHK